MLSENMLHTDGVTTFEKRVRMVKRKKDVVCARIVCRFYEVLSELVSGSK